MNKINNLINIFKYRHAKIAGYFLILFPVRKFFEFYDKLTGNAVFYKKSDRYEGVLHIHPSDGIGSRISYMAQYFKHYKTNKIFVSWPAYGWVNAAFNDLFILENHSVKEINRYIPSKSGEFNFITTELLINIDLKYDKAPQELKSEYKEFFASLKPSQKVMQKLDEFLKKHCLKDDFTALFIRNNCDWSMCNRHEELSCFIEALPCDKPVFLSCMNKETAAVVRKNFKGVLLELDNKNYRSMIDAVADAYIMSKAKNAVYSYGSTFCDLAYWLGGCKQKVTVIGSKDKWIR